VPTPITSSKSSNTWARPRPHVAMEGTEGMVRGMKAIDLGGPIRMPVGKETLAACST